jgi:hypothetical protein
MRWMMASVRLEFEFQRSGGYRYSASLRFFMAPVQMHRAKFASSDENALPNRCVFAIGTDLTVLEPGVDFCGSRSVVEADNALRKDLDDGGFYKTAK